MFHDVLVGYDGGDTSEDALAFAGVFAGPTGTITAACAGANADAVLARLSERERPRPLTVAARGRTPAHALRDLVDERGYDLVVVGSTHRGKVGRVLAGTTADALLHGGPCAVAVAPLGYRDRGGGLRRIGVGFDGTDASRHALAAAHAIAADRGAELVVLRVYSAIPAMVVGDETAAAYAFAADPEEPQRAAQAGLDAAIAGLGGDVPVRGELMEGDPRAVLAERSADLDLLVVGSKGHGTLGRVLLGSVSHYLMHESAAPVLAVPPE